MCVCEVIPAYLIALEMVIEGKIFEKCFINKMSIYIAWYYFISHFKLPYIYFVLELTSL